MLTHWDLFSVLQRSRVGRVNLLLSRLGVFGIAEKVRIEEIVDNWSVGYRT